MPLRVRGGSPTGLPWTSGCNHWGAILEDEGTPRVWRPSPRPTVFDSSDDHMVTPPSGPLSPLGPSGVAAKRKASRELEAHQSASPNLGRKESRNNKMQRTPQATLTQTKLTGLGVVQNPLNRAPNNNKDKNTAEKEAPDNQQATASLLSPEAMEVPPSQAPEPPVAAPQAITADFLLRALRENKEDIVKSFNANIGALAGRVDANEMSIASNTAAIAKNKETTSNNSNDIKKLTSRIELLEKTRPQARSTPTQRANLSEAYLAARRSVRVWPIRAANEVDLWGEVGEFLHGLLQIPEENMNQDDIEAITRVGRPDLAGNIHNEVIVKFFDKRKRDDVFANASYLSTAIDKEGTPTAGLRLEVPRELEDTFRLLSRFGTRLRARHGRGTKRHVKFDDFCGSLYANIKLPGDTSWTRVTPDMAREDLERSMREENELNQTRMAAKLLPGPRERLGRPLPVVAVTAGPSGIRVVGAPPAGKRPRWSVPDRGQERTSTV